MESPQTSRERPVAASGRATVFLVGHGTVCEGESVPSSSLVERQMRSLRKAGLRVVFGAVDDRTSVRGIRRNLHRLSREIAATDPDIVHATYGSVVAKVAGAARGARSLVVSYCGDDLLGTPNAGLRWRIRERLARAASISAAKSAGAVVVKSENLLRALPPALRGKAVVIPNGVDLDAFFPGDRSACRGRLGWDPDEPVVLFNGSHSDNQAVKNLPLARAVVERIRRSLPGTRLHVMSTVPAEDVATLMNAADCLLLTSLHEGSPNVVKEAMACGLPVVAVACGDVVERLRGVHPGGVGPHDPDALATLALPVLREGRRSNGRESIVRQHLSDAEIATRLIVVYERLLVLRRAS